MARPPDRLVEELIEVLGADEGMIIEVGAKGDHDAPDILDLLFGLCRDDGHRGQNHEGDECPTHNSSRLTNGS